MMNLTARMDAFGRVVFNFIKTGEDLARISRSWKSIAVDDRSGQLDRLSPAGYSKSDYDRSWSSQEWKSEVTAHDRSGKLEKVNSQEGSDSETFVMGSDAAEFVDKVKDQVRSRQKRMSNVAESGEEHSKFWGMFIAATMNAATFMGKNFLDNQNSIKNSTDLALKKRFDISEKLVSEQEEMNNLDKMSWKNHSWKQLSLIGDETVINLQRIKVHVFSDSVLCLGKVHQHPESNEAWKKRIEWIINEKSSRDYDAINGEPTEFEWNIFPGFTTLQFDGKVTDLLSKKHQKLSQEELYLCRCSTTFPVTVKAIKKHVWQMPESSKFLQRSLVLVNGHLLVQVLKISGILWKRIVHKEFGIISRTKRCWNSQKADVLFSVQQLHCPGVISKAKDTENCRHQLRGDIEHLLQSEIFRIHDDFE